MTKVMAHHHRGKRTLSTFAAVGLATMLVITGASAAHADDEYFVTTSHVVSADKTTISITLESFNPWIYPTSVEVNGVHSYGPTVDNRTGGTLSGPPKLGSATRTITFECGTENVVRYRVDAGSERDLYVGLPVGEWTEVHLNPVCPTEDDGEEEDTSTPPSIPGAKTDLPAEAGGMSAALPMGVLGVLAIIAMTIMVMRQRAKDVPAP